jgi:N-acetylmuramoyl-L-alanine amidase
MTAHQPSLVFDRRHRVADAECPAFHDARAQAAHVAHRVEPAGAERFFHARTRIATVGAFEHDLADAEAPPLQCDQRNAGDHHVAAEQGRRAPGMARQRRDRGQVFGLDQRDAALAAAAAVAVADQPSPVCASTTSVGLPSSTSRLGRRPIHSTRPAAAASPSACRARNLGAAMAGMVAARGGKDDDASIAAHAARARSTHRCLRARLDARPRMRRSTWSSSIAPSCPTWPWRASTASACSTDSGTGNSGHYYIDRDGSVHQWVPNDRVAHHTRGYNPRSIGIELVNTGRFPRWLDAAHQAMDEAYTEAQIVALIALLGRSPPRFPRCVSSPATKISIRPKSRPTTIRRKWSAASAIPGPLFPWERVMDAVDLQRLG